MELTILMPCLNEAETVAICVGKALVFLHQNNVTGEVLVADNGSTDGSISLAENAGARVVHVPQKGYGNALRAGIAAAMGRFVIMGDADDSYDFSNLSKFIDRLRSGDALVMGNRFSGGIAPGAMPPLHRYLGNPVLSFIGKLLFKSKANDFHCGLRGFDRQAILGLRLTSEGMEFASEMVVKASLAGLRMSEVPTTLSVDGRTRPPHLRSWRDGWRHLRFLLMMSPRWLFLYPGLTLLALGALAQITILRGPVVIKDISFDIHTMLYASAATILGMQLIVFALLARAIGCLKNLMPVSLWFGRWLRIFTLERGLICGVTILIGGLALGGLSLKIWIATGLSGLDPTQMMRWAIPSVTLTLAGAEIIFASFVLSLIDIRIPISAQSNS